MEKNHFFSEKNIYNALVKREFFITYHNCGMQMPKTWDFGSGRNLVPLHSEIKRTASPPALHILRCTQHRTSLRREGADSANGGLDIFFYFITCYLIGLSTSGSLSTGEGGGRGRCSVLKILSSDNVRSTSHSKDNERRLQAGACFNLSSAKVLSFSHS